MALTHVFNTVDNRYTGIPTSGVTVKAFDNPSDTNAGTQLNIFASANSTPLPTPNEVVSDADGMYSFYIDATAQYKLRFYVGSVLIKTVLDAQNVGPTGATGPANSTYATTALLEAAAVANLSAILTEAGKSGTFTIREYVDFTSQVAADTGKINYIRSTADTSKVWVRYTVLNEAAGRTGSTSGLGVQADINARPTSATLAAVGGAALVGSNDAASGTLWTTVAGFVSKLLSSTGSAVIGFIQTGTGAVTRTLQDEARERVTITQFGVVMGATTGANRISNVTNFQKAIDYVYSVGGGEVIIPRGRLELDGTLLGKFGVNVRGQAMYGSVVAFYNSVAGIAIDLKGTGSGGYPADRIICTWSDMFIDGTNGHAALQCFRLGHNYRSDPLLTRIKMLSFGHYGINFDANNWNISLVDVELDQCGKSTSASSGIFKNPAVTDMNYINFTRCQIEGCGRSDSAAGGLNIQTTTLQTNRGWNFTDCIIEGNFGTDEAYFSNMRSVNFTNLYVERLNVAGQLTGLEFSNVTGYFNGGVFAAAAGAPLFGLQFKAASEFTVQDIQFSGWATASIDSQASLITSGRNTGATFRIDGTAQPKGVFAPRFAANKGGTNQTGVADSVFTKVTFGTEDYDDTGAFDNATNHRFTPQTLGRYNLSASVAFTTMVDLSQVIVSIYRNGTAFRSAVYRANGNAAQSFLVSADVNVTATTDYFEIFVRQITGVAQTVSGSTDETYFSGSLLQ